MMIFDICLSYKMVFTQKVKTLPFPGNLDLVFSAYLTNELELRLVNNFLCKLFTFRQPNDPRHPSAKSSEVMT